MFRKIPLFIRTWIAKPVIRELLEELRKKDILLYERSIDIYTGIKKYKEMEKYYTSTFDLMNQEIKKLIAENAELKRKKTFPSPPLSSLSSYQFSDHEIRQLLSLCHSDKHGGKQMAQEITQKLLKIRSK